MRIRGSVKWMNLKKGYGMISAEIDGKQQDLLFHYSEILVEGFKYLIQGTPVTFELYRQTKPGTNGLKALKVKPYWSE